MSDGRTGALQLLVDKDEIRDVVATYARGVDRGDSALIRSCFWDDAVDDHGFATMTPDQLAEAAKSMTGVFDTTMHFLGNSIIKVDGDSAHSETYCVAFHRLSTRQGAACDRVVGFRIIDQLERRQLTWKFVERVYRFEWSRIDQVHDDWRTTLAGQSPALDAVLVHWPMAAGARPGLRDKSDPAYAEPGTRSQGDSPHAD